MGAAAISLDSAVFVTYLFKWQAKACRGTQVEFHERANQP